MRKYLVVRCSCGEESVLPVWSKDGKKINIEVSEDSVVFGCGKPECGAQLELLIRPITEKELDDLKACMSLCGTEQEVDNLTL